MASDRREDACLRWTTIVMAAFATTALEQSLAEPGQRSCMTWPGLPASFCRWSSRRLAAGEPPRRPGLAVKPWAVVCQPATIVVLLALFVFPFVYEAGRLVLTGQPAMAEVTLLAALRNLGLGLAAMADQPLFAKLSALVSLFLMTVATSLAEKPEWPSSRRWQVLP